MTRAPVSPSDLMVARNSMEDLATKCLPSAVTAAFVLSGNQPDKVEWPLAGRIAVAMAVAIRLDVAKHFEQIIASEGAEEFLRRLALEQGRELLSTSEPLCERVPGFCVSEPARMRMPMSRSESSRERAPIGVNETSES